ncbi:MAG TPA: AmmeMemoRadiSam system protein A [Thermoanaerobaculia bacterium]|nr:AmmeMemoRadiSam system protein A [Thermoanaerobaculia bacterium]
MSDPTFDPRGSLLLVIARGALERRLHTSPTESEDDGDGPLPRWLLEPAASFVSLHKLGQLRGCVGSLEAVRPLIEDVRHNALAAALEDSRFPPVAPVELGELRIEVTLLAARERISWRTERDAIDQLRPGVDGLLLSCRARRATFLPQVWESIPEPGCFLAALKEKAGLPARFWDRSIVLERYTARSWCEAAGPVSRVAM